MINTYYYIDYIEKNIYLILYNIYSADKTIEKILIRGYEYGQDSIEKNNKI